MAAHNTATFAEHIHELRKRLMWSLLFVAIGAGVGYVLHGTILDILQQPLNEKLYYTNPTGAFSFIIKICSVFGLIVALPMIVYQTFGFFEPLVPIKTRRLFVWYVFLSVALAAAGIAFAYFISLPAALHFLVNFGSDGGNIQALITANEYFNFVLAYIAGFAVLFQLPLIITFINKVTPLKPSQLIGGTRYVILGSFVISAIITPTPDPLNQALMAGPIIVLYFLSVLVLAITNASKGGKKAKPVAPEVAIDSVDALTTENEFEPKALPQPAAPTPLASARPVVSHTTAQNPSMMRPRSRVVSDVVTSRSRPQVPLAQPRMTRPQVQQPQQPVRLISDFRPATE